MSTPPPSTKTMCADRCTIPTYIYKLVPYDPSAPIPLKQADLPDALPVSDVDQASGFVHLSTATQLRGTLDHFFVSDTRVYVLRIPYGPLAHAGLIRWEGPEVEVCGDRPGEGSFPHLYNGLKLGRAEIESVWVLERDGDGWEVVERDGAFRAWLVY